MDVVGEIGVNMLVRSVGILVVCVWLGFNAYGVHTEGVVEQVERDITDVSSRGE